jgi:hypothetical protein
MDLTQELKWLELDITIKRLEAEVKDLKEQREAAMQDVLDGWSCSGLGSIRLNGETIYVRNEVHADLPEGKPAAIALLKETEHAAIVKEDVNSKTLDALVRELTQNDENDRLYDKPLPPEFEGVIGKFERQVLGRRKAD